MNQIFSFLPFLYKHSTRVFILGVCVICTIAGVGAGCNNIGSDTNYQKLEQSIEVSSNISVVLRDGELWRIDEDIQEEKQLTNTKGQIQEFTTSKGRRMIAYVLSSVWHESLGFGKGEADHTIGNGLYLIDLDKQVIQELVAPLSDEVIEVLRSAYDRDNLLSFFDFISLRSPFISRDDSKIYFLQFGLQMYDLMSGKMFLAKQLFPYPNHICVPVSLYLPSSDNYNFIVTRLCPEKGNVQQEEEISVNLQDVHFDPVELSGVFFEHPTSGDANVFLDPFESSLVQQDNTQFPSIFLDSGELWYKDAPMLQARQLTHTQKRVREFATTDDLRVVVYTLNDIWHRDYGPGDKEGVEIGNGLYILDTDSQEVKELIPSLSDETIKILEDLYTNDVLSFNFFVSLDSLVLNNDGTRIFFWWRGLNVLDIASGKLSVVFPVDSSFCSLHLPIDVSFNGRYLAVNTRCFEGTQDFIFDLDNKYEIVYDGGHWGSAVEGFVPEKVVAIISDWVDYIPYSGQEDWDVHISLYDVERKMIVGESRTFQYSEIQFKQNPFRIIHTTQGVEAIYTIGSDLKFQRVQ